MLGAGEACQRPAVGASKHLGVRTRWAQGASKTPVLVNNGIFHAEEVVDGLSHGHVLGATRRRIRGWCDIGPISENECSLSSLRHSEVGGIQALHGQDTSEAVPP
jgi:hypothetical protein